MTTILKTEKLTRHFGGLAALHGVNIEFREGEILGIIGPNGAGKTTLINVIAGIYLPTEGKIVFNGEEITDLPSHKRCRLGIGRTFQLVRPLPGLSLLENVMVGSLFGRGLGQREAREKAGQWCEFLGLSDVTRKITRMTVLEIKKMEIARALAAEPRLLFLDEVMAGLNSDETHGDDPSGPKDPRPGDHHRRRGACHEGHSGIDRPGCRPGLGRSDRRRSLRGSVRRSQGDYSLSGRGCLMLAIENINIFHGKLHILWDVSLEVGKESVGLFGPNGAGKTTLIDAVLGLLKPASGEIRFDGGSLLSLETFQRVRRGLSVVPQERELFPGMTVMENLRAGAAYIPEAKGKARESLDFVLWIFPGLKERLKQPAGTLSGGGQRMLAIGRALMADPKMLILDEPSCGLQPSIVSELFRRLKEIKTRVSLLIAEQNVRQCLKAIDRGYVIENGRIVMEKGARDLAGNDHIRRSYLGL